MTLELLIYSLTESWFSAEVRFEGPNLYGVFAADA